MSTTLLKAQGLVKHYGSRTVVKGISMSVFENEILAIIGPNGAGKSTMIEMVLGLKKQDAGEVNYWNKEFRKSVGVQLQSTPFFPGLTAFENLQLFAAFYKKKLSKQEGIELLTLCGLGDVMKTEGSKLSGGQQKRLAIAVALVHNPKVVFLDEPTAALDPVSRREIHQLVKNLHNRGASVVFTSHDMEEVSKLSHRVMMIDQGTIIAEGSAIELCELHNVKTLEELYIKLTIGGLE
ncbi:ABC-2 type transport system ATP-binding protein [Ureibacillus xyleni]|uniref:ABC-2 type transport system ATP-binding protein n=1 Tax=Ureibacillus xyleni TaxID=614648 RepID=A0A285SLX2_9BACL|nr:ABC transporter ATP-binding protein [Ureibacillus xyleni]SOC08403.1 ABC-2 type transport system ATP-binding protein [Ureibacillus xyleni]